jgi:hypothetical protein
MLLVISIGIIAAFITIFLNYCIGKPGGEFSPYEIFSDYTVWLSIKRLQKAGLYSHYLSQYNENLNRTGSKHEVIDLKNDFKKMLYNAADPYFTWERAVGMCTICTGFWIALFIALFFTFNLIEIITIVVISHITIRLLNKVL